VAERYTISVPDDVDERLAEELDSYGDNRSAVVTAALREYFGLEEPTNVQ